MSAAAGLAQVVASLLHEDPRRILLGEDVADGGMIGLSSVAAKDPTLQSRIIATPLGTNACIAHAAGLALGGARPIVLLPSAHALIEGVAAVRETAAVSPRSGGQRHAPVLFVAPNGAGFGLGSGSSDACESMLARIDGLRICVAGTSGDLEAALRSAADVGQDDPVVLLLPRSSLLGAESEPVTPLDAYGDLVRVRDPAHPQATVFCWGGAVEPALRAADATAAGGHAATVVELRTLSPLDVAGVLSAAEQTGKIVIAHEGARTLGFGAELAALLADEAILHLDAPIIRVTGLDGQAPFASEHQSVPTAAAIANAIVSVATY